MEGLNLLLDLIQPRDWMMKLDLKDIYLQIPIHADHQPIHLRRKTLYVSMSSFWPLSSTIRFSKPLKPVVGFLSQIGLCVIIYVSGQHAIHAYKQVVTDNNGSNDLQTVQFSWADGQYGAILSDTNLDT